MLISPNLMRLMLLICMLSMVILAVLYLRQRRLTPLAYALWGLAAILIPVVGPFFVISMKPGGQQIQAQSYQTQNTKASRVHQVLHEIIFPKLSS